MKIENDCLPSSIAEHGHGETRIRPEVALSWSRAYDAGKAVAIVLVVLAHVTRWYTGQGVNTPVQPSRPLALLTDYIYMFHMPLFIFVSGCVYGICIDKGKYTNNVKFLLNKARRLLIPYYIWGMLVIAPFMVGVGVRPFRLPALRMEIHSSSRGWTAPMVHLHAVHVVHGRHGHQDRHPAL